MWSAVFFLSLVVAMDPVRVGITALLLSRPRPVLNLFVFWLGGMTAGITVALVVLLFLRDLALPVLRVAISTLSSPTAAHIQVVHRGSRRADRGALLGTPACARGSDRCLCLRAVLQPNTVTASGRLSIRERLEGGSLVVVFVAGLALATPPVEYLAALIMILASTATVGAQVGAALMFTLVAFTVVEVPLIGYLTTPTKTLAVVRRLNEWIRTRQQVIPSVLIGVVGALLLVTGMGKV